MALMMKWIQGSEIIFDSNSLTTGRLSCVMNSTGKILKMKQTHSKILIIQPYRNLIDITSLGVGLRPRRELTEGLKDIHIKRTNFLTPQSEMINSRHLIFERR